MALNWVLHAFSGRRAKGSEATPEPLDPESSEARCLEFIENAQKTTLRLQRCDELGFVHLFVVPFPGLDVDGLVKSLCKEVGCFREARHSSDAKTEAHYKTLAAICEAARPHIMEDATAATRYIRATQQIFMLRMLHIGRYRATDGRRVMVHTISPLDGKYFDLPLIVNAFKGTSEAFSEDDIAMFRLGYRTNRKMMDRMSMIKNSVWIYPHLDGKSWTQHMHSMASKHSAAYMTYVEQYREKAEAFFHNNKFTFNKHAVRVEFSTLALSDRTLVWDVAQMLCKFVLNQNNLNAWGVQPNEEDAAACRRYMRSSEYLHERRGMAVIVGSLVDLPDSMSESASSISTGSSRSAPQSSSSRARSNSRPESPAPRKAQSARNISLPLAVVAVSQPGSPHARQSSMKIGASPRNPSSTGSAPAGYGRSTSFNGTDARKRGQPLYGSETEIERQESVRQLNLLDEIKLRDHSSPEGQFVEVGL